MKHLFVTLMLLCTAGLHAQTLDEIEEAYQALKICALNEYAASTDALYQKAKTLADSRLNEDGSVIQDFQKGSLEQMAIGRLYNELYRHTQEDRYKKATNWIHHYLVMSYPRNKKTTAQNVFIYNEKQANQMRLEGLYWAVSYFAEWVGAFDARNTQAWSDIADQFMLLNTQTYNSVTGVNYVMWTSDVENDETEGLVQDGVFKGCLPQYSALSMARMFSAAVDVLAVIPKEQPDRATLTVLVNQLAEGLMHWKGAESHQWSQNLVYSDGEEVTPDAAATELITAAYLKALRLELIKESDYKAFATATYDAAKARGCGALLTAEYDAYQKALAAKKAPVRKAPVRRPAAPVKK